jgi:hypothetical protein
MANRGGRGRTNTARNRVKFEHRLVLANWLLDLFEAKTLEDLAKGLKDSDFEGLTENNITEFHKILTLRLFERSELSNDILLAYDENIVQHWKQITEKRNRKEGRHLNLKYFQYLCLLFTEIYLDRYFRNSEKLLADLNEYTERFNAGETLQQHVLGSLFAIGLPNDARIVPYTEYDLKKLAFWSATGSGKTLLMHVNIMQYRYYLKLHGRQNELNRIILLTPNEGLSLQHRDEFQLSGMFAELFAKDAGRPWPLTLLKATTLSWLMKVIAVRAGRKSVTGCKCETGFARKGFLLNTRPLSVRL